MAEGGKKKSHSSSKAELMVKTMVMKKLQSEGSIGDVAGLEDYEIPPEHEELLTGLTKLFKSADRNFLTLAELREFVSITLCVGGGKCERRLCVYLIQHWQVT